MAAAPVLVADLSAPLCLALVSGGNVLVTRVRENVRGESAHGLLDECFAEAGIGPESLSAICVGAGPGSFTGIRVGVALAEGLAFARRLPLYPFSSLAGLRACAPRGPAAGSPRFAAGIIAANAGRYYAASESPATESLLSSDEVASLAANHPVLVTSGPVPDRDRFAGIFREILRFEDAVDFAKIAALALSGAPVLDGVVRPNYLMPSAAEAKRLGGA